VAGEVAVQVDEPRAALPAEPFHSGIAVAEPAHLLRPDAGAIEIAGAVGGIVDVRDQDHRAGKPVAHDAQDRVEVVQDGPDSGLARAVRRADEAEQVVPAGGQRHQGLASRIDSLQRVHLRVQHGLRRRPVPGLESTVDSGRDRDEIAARELRPYVVVVAGQEGSGPEAGHGQGERLSVGVIEVRITVDRHAVAQRDVGRQSHQGIISDVRSPGTPADAFT